MQTGYTLTIEVEGKTNDIYVDVTYSITEAQKGGLWQENIDEDVDIWSVCYGETDIIDLLSSEQLRAIEKDLLPSMQQHKEYA